MAVTIKASYIVRKHDLIRKQSKTGLEPEEEKELKELYKMTKDVNDELAVLHSQGVKLVNGEPVKEEEIEAAKAKSDKPKMSPSERKMRAEKIMEDMRARNEDDKDIIIAISADLGVSNTYGYKLVKGKV